MNVTDYQLEALIQVADAAYEVAHGGHSEGLSKDLLYLERALRHLRVAKLPRAEDVRFNFAPRESGTRTMARLGLSVEHE